jgi:hypothetical protein
MFSSFLPGSAAWAAASQPSDRRRQRIRDLAHCLGKPWQCNWADGRALNGGSYADGLIVVGDAVCPTDDGSLEIVPYYWRDGNWVEASLPDDTFYDVYIDAVSDNPAEPVMVYATRRSDGDDTTPDGLALLVVEADQDQLNGAADGHEAGGTLPKSVRTVMPLWPQRYGRRGSGYVWRAVRWMRTGTGGQPQDIGEVQRLRPAPTAGSLSAAAPATLIRRRQGLGMDRG